MGVAIQAVGGGHDVGSGCDDVGAGNGVGVAIAAGDVIAARIAAATCNVTAATAPGGPASWPVSQ
jgi:hypothetical protein